MTNQQIHTFLVVARHKSFTKAAEELYMTQPAVSRLIRTLETELGQTLFDRTCRSTQLTPAGEIFDACFRECESLVAAAGERARALDEVPRIPLILGMLTCWDLSGFLPELLDQFTREHPDVEIRLQSYEHRSLLSALMSNSIDIALAMDTGISYGDDVDSLPLTRIPHVLIYSAHHPNAALESPTPQDFKQDLFFVVGEREAPQAAELVRGYCRPYHFVPAIQILPNNESMLDNVRNGMGVAIMGNWSRACGDPNFKTIGLGSSHQIKLYWKKSNPKAPIVPFLDAFSALFHQ